MPLIDFIRRGDLASVIDQVNAGVELNHTDEDGLTPLMIASGFGQPQTVEILLRAGANVLSLEPRMGATALHKAAQSGNADVIALLLDHGAFIDQQSPTLGHTAIMDAVLHKREAAVRFLLERGAKTLVRTHYDMTALDLARADGLKRIVQLIEAQEQRNVSLSESKELIAAVKANDIDKVGRLIATGAFVDERAPMMGTLDDDYTALGLAARDGYVEIARLLLDAGADIRQLNGLMRATAGHEAGYMGNAKVARLLTEHSVGRAALDIDVQGAYNGYTALHDAVWHGHLETVQVLIEAGANLDLKTHSGLTPYELACLHGYDSLARFLCDAERSRWNFDPRNAVRHVCDPLAAMEA